MPKVVISKKVVAGSLILYHVKIDEEKITLKFTSHAIERIQKWSLKIEKVIDALIFSEEVVIGHGGRFIAHKTQGKRLIRVIYEYRNNAPIIITVYAPKKERYFQGGGKYADKIFPRS